MAKCCMVITSWWMPRVERCSSGPAERRRNRLEFGKATNEKRAALRRPFAFLKWNLLCFERLDHHELAHGSAVFEYDFAADLGEERVIFSATDVEPRLYASAALANDDSATGHDLTAECLESKTLRVRIAPIS